MWYSDSTRLTRKALFWPVQVRAAVHLQQQRP